MLAFAIVIVGAVPATLAVYVYVPARISPVELTITTICVLSTGATSENVSEDPFEKGIVIV
jgi:hypothetical protein